VIDELMGHAGGRRGGGSPMGRVYRETTPAMLARVTAALDERIARARRIATSTSPSDGLEKPCGSIVLSRRVVDDELLDS
jgi:hypothetical protein